MLLIIGCYHYLKYDDIWSIKIYSQNSASKYSFPDAKILTDVKICFVVLEETYRNIFLSYSLLIKTSALINTWHLGLTLPNYSEPPILPNCSEGYIFQNRSVPCNYQVREEETRSQIFGLMCRDGGLGSFPCG